MLTDCGYSQISQIKVISCIKIIEGRYLLIYKIKNELKKLVVSDINTIPERKKQ